MKFVETIILITAITAALFFIIFILIEQPIVENPPLASLKKPEKENETLKQSEEKNKSLEPEKLSQEIEASTPSKDKIIEEEYVLITTPILRVRTEPTVNSTIVWNLRQGMVLKAKKVKETETELWYGMKIKWLECNRYPQRFPSPETWWYFAGKYDKEGLAKKIEDTKKLFSVFPETKNEDKWIKIILSKQELQAYEGKKEVFSIFISTGLKGSPTPIGNFEILKSGKKLSVCMQGPLLEFGFDDKYDLAGIGWVMYFTHQGAALHGTYWHQSFGRPHSHGCINLKNQDAEWLYWWTPERTKVLIIE